MKACDFMKRILALLLSISCVLAMTGCYSKERMNEDMENIKNATDYAVSVFQDANTEERTIVRASSSVNHNVDDAVYHITLTYTIGDDDMPYFYDYTILKTEEQFEILEEGERFESNK